MTSWVWPLVALDTLAGSVLNLMGPPGRFLASPAGRDVLGYTGVLMILTALGWGVSDWFRAGWTW